MVASSLRWERIMGRFSMVARLLVVLVGLSLAAPSPVVVARQATPAASPVAGADEVYRDPNGQFTIPIPTNWEAETVEGVAVLTAPDNDITVYGLTITGDDVAAAIDEAWRQVEPDFALEPEDTFDAPAPPEVEQVVVVTYDSGEESGTVVQGVGQLVDGAVYVLLVEADLAAAMRRNAQIQIVFSGFTITAVATDDLTGTTPRQLTDELLAELETYVAETMEQFAIPGAAVAIVQDGDVVYEQGFGVREQGGSEPVTPDTLMMIGSTTKSMTTMMMATLVDDGLMDWDTPVVDILPSFAVADPELTQALTMRNLVCACTGVPRRDLELVFNSDELTAEAVVASLADFTFFTDFGEAFQYSNQMVATGGYIAALAAEGADAEMGPAYVDALRERVLDPIGMDDSTLSLAEASSRPDHATPHGIELTGGYAPVALEIEEFVIPVAPAGALWSNVRDMAKYLQTELSQGVAPDGERVVSAENLTETWQPQVPVSAETSYGLGWFIDAYKGIPLIHHGGNTSGFTSDFAFVPDADLGIVVLTNGSGTNLFNVAVRTRWLELAFDQQPTYQATVDFGLEQQGEQLAEVASMIGETVVREDVLPLVGQYTNPVLGDLLLTLESDRLLLDAGEFQTELRPLVDESGDGEDLIATDYPTLGLTVEVRRDSGVLGLVITDPASAEEYLFVQAAAGTPPAATPGAATPVAMR